MHYCVECKSTANEKCARVLDIGQEQDTCVSYKSTRFAKMEELDVVKVAGDDSLGTKPSLSPAQL